MLAGKNVSESAYVNVSVIELSTNYFCTSVHTYSTRIAFIRDLFEGNLLRLTSSSGWSLELFSSIDPQKRFLFYSYY